MRILAYFALLQILAHQIRLQALKMALIGAAIIMLAVGSSMAATITVHAPDGEDRVFVDVVGRIENGDFETFNQKTNQIEASHPKKLVIVTLMSYGGVIHPAMQIGELVRKRRMLTFVPGDRTCASACALIWVAGWLRTVGDTPQIGFHAAYDKDTQRETGAANALVGAYLRDLEFSYNAIHFMTRKGPTALEWLTPDLAKEVGVAWFMLQPPRAIPLPPQQPGLQPPLQVIAAWSKLMPRPVTASPERGNSPAETLNLRFPALFGVKPNLQVWKRPGNDLPVQLCDPFATFALAIHRPLAIPGAFELGDDHCFIELGRWGGLTEITNQRPP